MPTLKKGYLTPGREADIFVEDVAYQRAFIHALENAGCPAEGVKVGGMSKEERLYSISHILQAGKLFFPSDGSCDLLIRQLTHHGVEKHEDLGDAFVTVVSKFYEDLSKPVPNIRVIWSSPYHDMDKFYRSLENGYGW